MYRPSRGKKGVEYDEHMALTTIFLLESEINVRRDSRIAFLSAIIGVFVGYYCFWGPQQQDVYHSQPFAGCVGKQRD